MGEFAVWRYACHARLCVAALIFCVAWNFPLVAEAIDVSPGTLERVDQHVAATLERVKIPGGALAIVHKGKILVLKGYGTAGPEGRPVDGSTAFVIGSVSKSVTALAVMNLVEQGQLDLEAPVQKYLPWFRTADAQITKQMIVRHLMSHTSGLSMSDGRQTLAVEDQSPDAIERECRRLAQSTLQFTPGERYEYSNSNFDVLGAIVEAVTGQPFDEAMREYALGPLGMNQSFYFRGGRDGNLAAGHRLWFGWPVEAHGMPAPRQHWPSGYLCSTAEDMARYLVAHLQGDVGIAGLVSGQGLAQLHTPQATVATDIKYAMGLLVVTRDGKSLIAHEGSVPGYYAHIMMYPEDDLGIVLLCNAFSVAHSAMPLRYSVINAGRILQGQQRDPVPRDWLATGAIAVVASALVLQAALAVRMLRRLWRARVASDLPRGERLRVMVLPAVAYGLLGLALLVGVPWFFEMPLSGILLFVPDFGWLLVLCAAFAWGWGIIRAALVWRWSRG
jgi:CubicO group peptidase (beta-lactamase class C family)